MSSTDAASKYNEMYILDSQEKTDPRDTCRFLPSHGKLSSFRVRGKVWTFFCTVRFDLPWDDSKDLVEIARGKTKEAEGSSERPTQSNNCQSTAIYRY